MGRIIDVNLEKRNQIKKKELIVNNLEKLNRELEEDVRTMEMLPEFIKAKSKVSSEEAAIEQLESFMELMDEAKIDPNARWPLANLRAQVYKRLRNARVRKYRASVKLRDVAHKMQ